MGLEVEVVGSVLFSLEGCARVEESLIEVDAAAAAENVADVVAAVDVGEWGQEVNSRGDSHLVEAEAEALVAAAVGFGERSVGVAD